MIKKIKEVLLAILSLVAGIIVWFFGVMGSKYYHYSWEKSVELIVVGIFFFVVGVVCLLTIQLEKK
jgi:hypothetical protein